mmetsp:Transcript_32485/g.103936  ORF Transcript_32485/g.103936 Transcript_32485/m.103936 type:complete len:200 (-) Transcript_32485:1600-2199(-)
MNRSRPRLPATARGSGPGIIRPSSPRPCGCSAHQSRRGATAAASVSRRRRTAAKAAAATRPAARPAAAPGSLVLARGRRGAASRTRAARASGGAESSCLAQSALQRAHGVVGVVRKRPHEEGRTPRSMPRAAMRRSSLSSSPRPPRPPGRLEFAHSVGSTTSRATQPSASGTSLDAASKPGWLRGAVRCPPDQPTAAVS